MFKTNRRNKNRSQRQTAGLKQDTVPYSKQMAAQKDP